MGGGSVAPVNLDRLVTWKSGVGDKGPKDKPSNGVGEKEEQNGWRGQKGKRNGKRVFLKCAF